MVRFTGKHQIFRKYLFLFVVVLISFQTGLSAASTTISSNIIFDTTWTKAGSPYIVTQTIDIYETGPGGVPVTLTINPGVTVKFAQGAALNVRGTLVAIGTASELITFTSNQTTPARGAWGGIVFQSTSVGTIGDISGNYVSGSIIKYSEISYGGGLKNPGLIDLWIMNNKILNNSYISGGGIHNTGNSVISANTISSNTSYRDEHGGIYDNEGRGGGIYNTGNAMISGNTISGNSADVGGGIYNTGNATISGNTISSNDAFSNGSFSVGGIYNTGNATISGNTISANTSLAANNYNLPCPCASGGIYNTGNATISGNTISGNSASSYYSVGGILDLAGATISGNIVSNNTSSATVFNASGIASMGGATISGNIVSDNTHSYSVASGIYSESNYSTINNNTVTGNSGHGIESVNGITTNVILNNVILNNALNGIRAMGTATIMNNTIIGNGDGGIYNSGDSTITGNLIKANLSVTTSALYNSGSSSIENNDIICNSTLYGIMSSPLQSFSSNNLVNPNTPYEFYYTGSTDLTSSNNYWGTTNTVDLFNRIYDYWHDVSLGQVNYAPLATTPFGSLSANGGCDINADFVGIPVQGTAPLFVSFADLSSDSPTSWLWSFGDNLGGYSSSKLQNPTHVYKNSGTYTVSLSTVGTSGASNFTKTAYITVDPCTSTKAQIVVGATYDPYDSIQTAYGAAQEGDVIKALAIDFPEVLTFGENKTVTLMGGFACDYSPWQIGYTYVESPFTINNGTIIADRIAIQ